MILQAFNTSDKKPKRSKEPSRSVQVLIDMTGERKHFETGLYNFDLEKWLLISSPYEIKLDKMLWTEIEAYDNE